MPARKWWGWGYEDDGVDDVAFERDCLEALDAPARQTRTDPIEVPSVRDTKRFARRVSARLRTLADLASDEPSDRLAHAYGKAYVDLVRAVRGDVPNPVDYVAYPRTEEDIARLLASARRSLSRSRPTGAAPASWVASNRQPALDFMGSIALDLRQLRSPPRRSTNARAWSIVQAGCSARRSRLRSSLTG